jgi:PST family polysaccharide transporter
MVLSWLMARWLPGLPRHSTKVRSLVRFGGDIAASYLIFNVIRNADNVLIGWRWGAGPLGLYSRAFNLLMLPVRQLSGPAGNVAVPTFSRIQTDPERFANYYLRLINVMMWISTPIFAILFVAAKPVIIVVLGKQWLETVTIFQILAISAPGQLVLETTVWLLVSRGQSGRLLRLFLGISPIIVGSFLVGLPFGAEGVALSGTVALIGMLPWILMFTFRRTDLTLWRFGRAIVCPTCLSLAGVVVAELALYMMGPRGIPSECLVIALAFVAVYLLSALIRPVRDEGKFLRKLMGHAGLSVELE